MFSSSEKKTLAVYSGLALLFIYPLIQAGIFYRDDLDRAITGQYGWRSLGRPIADILSKVLSASGHVNLDLYPYTMLGSCLFLGAAALLLSQHLQKAAVRGARLVAALLMFNPYFLQNLAYRYDSLGMALAFFLAVLAYTYDQGSPVRQLAVKIVAGVAALALYQPCSNVFIGLLAVDVMILAVNSAPLKVLVRTVINKAVCFIAFLLIYMVLFAKKSNARAETLSPNAEGWRHLLSTLEALNDLVLVYFHGPVYLYFVIPAAVGCLALLAANYKNGRGICVFFLYSLLALLIYLFSLMGLTVLLKEAPVFPRILVSFSVLLVMIAIPIMQFSPRLKYAALVPAITVFAFSAQLSSALKSQREYEDRVFDAIASDLAHQQRLDYIGTVGQVNIDERAKLILESKPLVSDFLSPAADFLASFQLINKGYPQTSHGYSDSADNATRMADMVASGVKPVAINKDYALYVAHGTAIVALGDRR